MQDRLEPESGKHLPAFFEMVDTAQILPMVARTTIHALNRNDPNLFRTFFFSRPLSFELDLNLPHTL